MKKYTPRTPEEIEDLIMWLKNAHHFFGGIAMIGAPKGDEVMFLALDEYGDPIVDQRAQFPLESAE